MIPFVSSGSAQRETSPENDGADLVPELALAEQRLAPDGPGWAPWRTGELGDVVLVRDDHVEVPQPYNSVARYSRAELVQLYTDHVTSADLERVHLVKTIFGGHVVRGEA